MLHTFLLMTVSLSREQNIIHINFPGSIISSLSLCQVNKCIYNLSILQNQCIYLDELTPSQDISQVELPHSNPTFRIQKFLSLKGKQSIYYKRHMQYHCKVNNTYFRREGNHLLKSIDRNVRIQRGSNV